jgi:CBS domain-containing protein
MSDMRVNDVMTRLVITVSPESSIGEAARRLARHRISAAPVVEEGKLVGILSEADIISALSPADPRPWTGSVPAYIRVSGVLAAAAGAHPTSETGGVGFVRDAMTACVVATSPSASIWEAASLMADQGVKRLPVTDADRRVVGIVSRADLVRVMARDDESIRADVIHLLQLIGQGSTHVDVEVDHGIVTLTGLVHDDETMVLARKLAARVPGVSAVRDAIRWVAEEGSVDVGSVDRRAEVLTGSD